jgi:hypothetical protein
MAREEVLEQTENARSYYIDFEKADELHRSLSTMIAARKCYVCKQADTDESIMASEPQEHIDRIVEICSDTSDYLLPDTPLKEAIFRVMLAEGTREITAVEISEILTARWAVSTYPRDLSPKVIGRLLDNSDSYCISAVLEPEPEPEEEEAAAPEPTADGAAEGLEQAIDEAVEQAVAGAIDEVPDEKAAEESE